MSLELRFAEVVKRNPVWFPDVWTAKPERHIAMHAGLELGSECGEVLDVIKRFSRVDGIAAATHRRQMPELLGRELSDVLCNVAVLASLFDVDLDGAMIDVIARNDGRFPSAR